jgi:hypothetical protein
MPTNIPGSAICIPDSSVKVTSHSSTQKLFNFASMDMRRRTGARRDDGFPQSKFAVGVGTGDEKAVHIADHGDGVIGGRLVPNG